MYIRYTYFYKAWCDQDIIISGGENISSLEVESIMMKNEKIAEVAVVARWAFVTELRGLLRPDEKWGETPVAWIVCRTGMSLTDEAAGALEKGCAGPGDVQLVQRSQPLRPGMSL